MCSKGFSTVRLPYIQQHFVAVAQSAVVQLHCCLCALWGREAEIVKVGGTSFDTVPPTRVVEPMCTGRLPTAARDDLACYNGNVYNVGGEGAVLASGRSSSSWRITWYG
jgi:hypothetical protein